MRTAKISLAEGAVLLLLVTLIFTFWNLTNQSRKASDASIERAFESAEVLSEFAATAHRHFTNTVNPVAAEYDIEFTTDPSAGTGALRFPATFSRVLTESFSERFPNSQFRIYSENPIRIEDVEERVLDDFALAAIDALRHAPDETFKRVSERDNGTTEVRLATPIVMQSGCVSCHNSPAFAVEGRVWEVGDVRGIREVSLTTPTVARLNVLNMPWLYGLITLASLLTLFVVYPSVRREVADRSYFHGLSRELEQMTEKLSEEVNLDALSGLHNRKSFDDQLVRRVLEAHETGLPLTLLTLDVDFFKNINDTYGHDVGDEVIRGIGAVLNSYVRGNDVAARIGGEEFAVIAAPICARHRFDLAQRMSKALCDHRFELDQQSIQITVSGGCVSLLPQETPADLYRRADRLLYEAKRSGRNAVRFDRDLGDAV